MSNKWGESLVLPTNESTVDIGTKIYYGLSELCILNFGENSISDAQCSPLTADMSRVIDATLERDIRIGKAIIATSIGLSLLLLIILVYGSIECAPHKLSNLKRHFVFLALSGVDCKCAKNILSLINYWLSRTGICADDCLYNIETTESPRCHWVSISKTIQTLTTSSLSSGGDSFGIGFIIGWISLLFKFNGLLILILLLHFKAWSLLTALNSSSRIKPVFHEFLRWDSINFVFWKLDVSKQFDMLMKYLFCLGLAPSPLPSPVDHCV